MWAHSTLYFGPDIKATDFDQYSDEEKLDCFLDRIQQTYLDVAATIDGNQDSRYGFASVMLSLAAIEALAKIYDMSESGSNQRFKNFCLNQLRIPHANFRQMELYGTYRNGIVHEGRLTRGFAVSYDTDEPFKVSEGIRLLNPKKFREKYLGNYRQIFENDKMGYGTNVKELMNMP